MGLLIGLIYGGLLAVVGLVYWAGAELPLVWRETAINTCKTEAGPQYNGLKTLAKILKVLAVIMWVMAVFCRARVHDDGKPARNAFLIRHED